VEALAEGAFPDRRDDPNLMVLRIGVGDAVYREAAGSLAARAFDFARGLLADLGKREHLEG
jgi:hypothetical protein